MANINVSLPDPMKDWVEAQVRTGRYDDVSGYVRDLILREQERVAKLAELQLLVNEGLDSGVSGRTRDDVRELSRRAAAHRA